MEIDRRAFLKLLGITTGAATAGVWSAKSLLLIPDEIYQRAFEGDHIETWKNSICGFCSGGCGIRVRLIDDIPVRITGNSKYPLNQGAVCPMAESSIEYLFHPDRIKTPLKRVGKRGNNRWEEISWEEAIDLVAARLQKLVSNDSIEQFVLIGHENNDLTSDFINVFMDAVGSPNYLKSSAADILALPAFLSQGWVQAPAYDIAHADFILNFGADLLDEEISPVYFNKIYGSSRSKIVHISSYQSRTAAASSQWYPINPGFGGALALGLANVIVRDGTYNEEYIQKSTFGFDDWTDSKENRIKGFKRLVLEDYSPAKVASMTGIEAGTIIDLAREFAAHDAALAIAGGTTVYSTNSTYSLYAIYCLNALKGNFEKPGGVLFPDKFEVSDFNQAILQNGQKTSNFGTGFNLPTNSLDHVIRNLDYGQEGALDTMLIHRLNPMFEATHPSQIKDALNEIPFIITSSTFLDETAMLADLILPEPTFLESWNLSQTIPTVEYAHMGVQQPIIPALYNNRQIGDVLLKVAQKLSPEISQRLHWESYFDFLQSAMEPIYQSGAGTIVSESRDYSWIKYLKARGWQTFDYSTFAEFWTVLLKNGGWWNPVYAKKDQQIYHNQTGKFEFYSTTLENAFQDVITSTENSTVDLEQLLSEVMINDRGVNVFLPHFEQPRTATFDPKYPLQLFSYPLLSNQPRLGVTLGLSQELSGIISREYWQIWAEINPDTANQYGIKDDEFLDIISKHGKMRIKTKLRPTVMPGSVMLPHGRFASSDQNSIYQLFSFDQDRISGIPSLISTKIKIKKSERQDHV